MTKRASNASESDFLDTLPGESAFFRAICDARPVGIHREFHMMAVASQIKDKTGQDVSVDELWGKFRRCYDVNILEGYEKPGFDSVGSSSSSSSDEDEDDAEMEGSEVEASEKIKDEENANSDDMDVDGSKSRTRSRNKRSSKASTKPPRARDPPRPGDDLLHHPFFRAEFALPVGNGWPPLPPSSVAGDTSMTGGGGHSRKDSVATTTRGRSARVRKPAPLAAESASTRGGTKSTRGKATVAATASVNESDSDLTSDGEKDGSGDGEDAEGEDVEENEDEAEAEAEEAATRRSTRTRGTVAKDTNQTTKTSGTKKKRGK